MFKIDYEEKDKEVYLKYTQKPNRLDDLLGKINKLYSTEFVSALFTGRTNKYCDDVLKSIWKIEFEFGQKEVEITWSGLRNDCRPKFVPDCAIVDRNIYLVSSSAYRYLRLEKKIDKLLDHFKTDDSESEDDYFN